jgi:hypothetical protein
MLPATPDNPCHLQHLCPPCPHHCHTIDVLCTFAQCSMRWTLIHLFPACLSVLPIPVPSSSLSPPPLPTAFHCLQCSLPLCLCYPFPTHLSCPTLHVLSHTTAANDIFLCLPPMYLSFLFSSSSLSPPDSLHMSKNSHQLDCIAPSMPRHHSVP